MRFLPLLLAFFVVACPGRREDPDTGSAGTDAPTRDVPLTSDDAPISPADAQAFTELVRALELATAASAPMGDDAMRLRGDAGATDMTGRDAATAGFSGGSVVTPATCAAYTWDGLMASVVLTGCTLESTGTPIAGTVDIAVTLRPVTFRLSFTALTVGASSYDGFVQLTVGGTDLRPMALVDVMLSYTSEMGSGSIAASGLSVSGESATGISVSGTLTFTNGGATTTVLATDVGWAPMECHPSSGTLAVDGGPFPLPATVTFLPTTPADGVVRVDMPPLPASMVMLLPPCV